MFQNWRVILTLGLDPETEKYTVRILFQIVSANLPTSTMTLISHRIKSSLGRFQVPVLLFNKIGGSVTFWYGSGSSDPYLRLTDPNADPGCPKPYGSYGSGTTVKSYEVKKQKKSRIFLLFCLMMEGSRAGAGSRAGSLLVTNESGCGSGSFKNIRILRIKINIPTLLFTFRD